MAFPTIPTVAAGRVLSALATSPSGTHTSPSLSSLTKNEGDLLIAIVLIYDGNSTNAEFSSWGGGFTEFGDFAGTATVSIGCAYKWSTGSETGTFTVTSADASTNDSAFFLLSIPGANATTPPEAGGYATGTTTACLSGALDPGGWGAEDTLWITAAAVGETGTGGTFTGIGTGIPTNYSDLVDTGISADVVGGIEGAVAFRQLNASSEGGTDADFANDTSNARWGAITIAVRPPGDVTVTVPEAGTSTASAPLPTIVETTLPAAAEGAASAPLPTITETLAPGAATGREIGRASCRERV